MKRQEEIEAQAKHNNAQNDKVIGVLASYNSSHNWIMYMAERFNAMRAQLSLFCDLLKKNQPIAVDLTTKILAVAFGDYAYVLDGETETPPDYWLQDAGLYAEALAEQLKKKNPIQRMKGLLMIAERLKTLKNSYDLRIVKMGAKVNSEGSTESETDTARVKIEEFKMVQECLQLRLDQCRKMYQDISLAVKKELVSLQTQYTELNKKGDVE